MRVMFSPEAQLEFEEAEHYYNRLVPQLGNQFRREIRDAFHEYEHGPCHVK